MKKLSLTALLGLSLIVFNGPVSAQPLRGESLQIPIIGLDGQNSGFVILRRAPKGVLINVSVTKMSPGWHGVHLHQDGICDPVSGFQSAGEIIQSNGQAHGFMNDGGPFDGDLPNIWVSNDRSGKAEYYLNYMTLDDLLRKDGKSLVVRAAQDDYMNQPLGNSGGGAVCAVLKR